MSEASNSAVDWGDARARVARAEQLVESAFSMGTQHAGDVLKARAKALAVRGTSAEQASQLRSLLVVRIGQSRFALPLDALSAVGEWQRPCAIPASHAALLGLIAARGMTWALYDLLFILVGNRSDMSLPGKILFMRGGDRNLALRVDGIEGVERVDMKTVQPPPEDIKGGTDLFNGLLNHGAIVIDSDRLRSHPSISKDTQP